MEMTLESLVASGLSQDLAKSVLEAHKAAVSGNFVPMGRFNEVNTQLTNANAQIKERDTQIAGLRKFEGDNTALQERITALETENKNKDAQMAAALLSERKSNAAKMKLNGKVHDVDLVLGLIDMEKVSFDKDGALTGFDDQLKPLQESKKYLFVEDSGKPNPFAGFKIVGSEPPEGGEKPPAKVDTPEAFGANLAKQKIASRQAAAKASEYYFKGGNN